MNRLQINAVFFLEDYRTVFVGIFSEDITFTSKAICKVFIDGDYFNEVEIEGEMSFTPNRDEARAISTLNKEIWEMKNSKANYILELI